MNLWALVNGVIALVLIATAIGLVYSKHVNRGLFSESQQLVVQRDRIEIEWRRLQLEQASLSTHARVEYFSRTRLNMSLPAADAIVMVHP